MLGDSKQYKDHLLGLADKLDRWHQQPRWTDNRLDRYEYEIFCSFYVIRRLIESHKISDRLAERPVRLQAFKVKTDHITSINQHKLSELYDLSVPLAMHRSLLFICNQLIHSFVFQIWLERGGRLTSLVFSSDRERRRHAYRLTRGTLTRLFRAVGKNYPTRMDGRFDDVRGDFIWRVRD